MFKKNAVMVLGYNNTRIKDVKKIREKASTYLGAATILCKRNPTADDKAAVDALIDVGLEATDGNVDKVILELKNLPFYADIVALLPFSDSGTQLAGALSSKFPHLRSPDPTKIKAALDKHFFREREKLATHIPPGYRKIRSEKITEFKQLTALYKKLRGRVFLKPAKEGNSRGCLNLMIEKDLKASWAYISQYATNGIVAEELVLNAKEYSWDYVNGYSWITEKKTTDNQYRAEFQHIVPAPLAESISSSVAEAGIFIAELAGYNNGACHNEVFYFPLSGNVSGVEPNLRPAGGKIWDLATLAFDNFDPWKEWILWASSSGNVYRKKLKQNYYAGIRKIQAPITGVLKSIPQIDIIDISIKDVEFIEMAWTKKIGDIVTSITKDNSDYIGYIIVRSKNYDSLNKALEVTCANLQNKIYVDTN